MRTRLELARPELRWPRVCLTAETAIEAEQFAQPPRSVVRPAVTADTGAFASVDRERTGGDTMKTVQRVRMPRFGLVAWGAVLLGGCGFDTGGVASGSASIGSVGNDTESADDDAATDADADAADDDDGDDAPATTAATADPTGDPTTDPTGDPTTDPTGDPTTDASAGSTGMIDPTTGVVDPTTGMVDPSTDAGDDGPPGDPLYPNCNGPNTCADGTQDCLEFIDGNSNVVANLCVPACVEDGDCQPPATGTAAPYCSDFSFFCRLDCAGGLTCPNGMSCYSLTNGTNRCAYML
jgi:hypothetical protein